jgi:RNA polymerase sigma factor (sigma-70 family)
VLKTPPRARRFVRSDPDERLVALVRAGERAAFEELYDRFTPGLLSYCRHLLGTLDEAEDAVQHAFLAAHRALLADDREIHLKAWLYAIARNRCLSMLRARRERVGFDEDLQGVPSTAGLAAEVEQREDLRALLGDLQHLPEDQRSALVLAEIGAHSHDEIGEVLGVKREKVKALVFQAREALGAARTARETPCLDIREELATAHGGALRRGNLRRHLDMCAGCRAFRDQVQHQRAAFSVLLPVTQSLALKQAVLGAAAVTAGGGAAVAGGGAVAGGAAAGGKAAAAKLLTVVVAAGSAGSGGYAAVHDARHGRDHVPTAVAESSGLVPLHAHDSDAGSGATPLPPRAATPPTPVPAAAPRHRHRAHKAKKAKPRAKMIFAAAKSHPAKPAPRARVIFASDEAHTPKHEFKAHKPKKAKQPKKQKHAAAAPPPPPAPAPPAQNTAAVAPAPAEPPKHINLGQKKDGRFGDFPTSVPGRHCDKAGGDQGENHDDQGENDDAQGQEGQDG